MSTHVLTVDHNWWLHYVGQCYDETIPMALNDGSTWTPPLFIYDDQLFHVTPESAVGELYDLMRWGYVTLDRAMATGLDVRFTDSGKRAYNELIRGE